MFYRIRLNLFRNKSDDDRNTGEQNDFLTQNGNTWAWADQQEKAAQAAGDTETVARMQQIKKTAHEANENYRVNQLGYSGGADGSEYKPIGSAVASGVGYQYTAPDAGSKSLDASSYLLNNQDGAYYLNPDNSAYYATPGKVDSTPYQLNGNNYGLDYSDYLSDGYKQNLSLYDDIINQYLSGYGNGKSFEYDYTTDPVYQSYAKAYNREGQRASANTLGQAAAATGGQVSSYAATAANQAGNYYASQLADKIPELYEAAYSRYQNEGNNLLNAAGLVNNQIGNYLTDANFKYGVDSTNRDYLYNSDYYNSQLGYNNDVYNNDLQYQADANNANTRLGIDQSNVSTLLGIDQDNANTALSTDSQNAEWNRDDQEDARAEVDAILAAGGTPSAELLAASGYSQEYVDTLANYYASQGSGTEPEDTDDYWNGTASQNSRYDTLVATIENQAKDAANGKGPYTLATVNTMIQRNLDAGLITEKQAKDLKKGAKSEFAEAAGQ